MARCLLNVRFPPKRPYNRHTRQVRQLVLKGIGEDLENIGSTVAIMRIIDLLPG
jgi:hypothetical protein